jgi:hypothetical protein
MRRVLVLTVLALLALPGHGLTTEAVRPSPRDPALALLDFFRRLTLTAADRERLEGLIRQLDARSYTERSKASALLLAEGPRVLPLLQESRNGASLEQSKRLLQCIKALDRPGWTETVAIAASRLKQLQPNGAAAVLLAYNPYAPEDAAGPILAALCATAVRHGRVDASVLVALDDPVPGRRAAAAFVVGSFGAAGQRQRVHQLLADPVPVVRLRAAAGLLVAREPAALGALVDLLATENAAVAEAAESLLQMVAGNSAPTAATNPDRTAADRRAAWRAWWEQRRAAPDKVVSALDWQLLLDPRAARLAGTRWSGVDGPEGYHTVYTFHADGSLTYAYRNGTFNDGSWKQAGRNLTFEVNNRYVESSGVIKWRAIEFESRNVKGVTWQTTLKPLPSP